MKTIKTITLGFAALAAIATSYSQQTPINPSVRDNPGVLGMSYGDISYRWHDIHRQADAYDIAFGGSSPVAPGVDVGLGYNYFWANDSHNPFTLQDYNIRLHSLVANATFFGPNRAARPFFSPIIGYQWSRGDLERLRTYDSQWVWGGSAGVEVPMGRLALTPRATFTDSMRANSIGSWHYGAEAHTWLNEKVGVYFDATYHHPQQRSGTQYWSYMGGLRYKF
jgi:hypothetical protein